MKKIIRDLLFKLNLLDLIYYRNNISHFFLKYEKVDINEVVICGMPRSGSTLVYNLVKEILEIDQDFVIVYNEKDYLDALKEGCKLIKCHKNLPIIKYRVKNNKAIGLFTHRNLLDIAVSFIQRKWHTIDKIINRSILRSISHTALNLANVKNMNLISYENHISDLEKLIEQLHEILNVSVDPVKMKLLVKKFSKDNINQSVSDSKTNRNFNMNSKTGFHENHFFDGKSNKYLTYFSELENKKLNKQIGEYNIFFSYEYSQ